MAVRRTKQQKLEAKHRIQESQQTYTETFATVSETSVLERDSVTQFFQYPVDLIYKDLLKTLLLTAFVIVLLFGISQYLS